MANRSVALVNRSKRDFSEVRRVAAAIQRQVLQDFGPTWGHTGAVIALEQDEPLPAGYSAVYLYDALEDPRLSGIHYYTARGEIYANVAVNKEPWSLSASHEVLEMIVDPTTDWKRSAPSLRAGQGTVEYLVEVCDPCQHFAFSYNIDGVVVSDFYGPNYFDSFNSGPGRYSMTGAVKRPLQILAGGYLSWRDSNGVWWRGVANGSGTVSSDRISGFENLPGDSIREKIDFYSSTLASVGCTIPLGRKYQKLLAQKERELRAQQKNLQKFGAQRQAEQEAHHQTVLATIGSFDERLRNLA